MITKAIPRLMAASYNTLYVCSEGGEKPAGYIRIVLYKG
jgi:hypothetical protein